MQLNINADMGESFGPWVMGNDSALLDVIASANLACGLHAGDPLVMQGAVRAARDAGVSIGAHPGFADLNGFGRRPMSLSDGELCALMQYQIGALQAIGRAEGLPVTHVKPHGALNNMACADRALADVLAGAMAALDPALILLAPAESALAKAGQAAGLPVALEVFADRTYEADGQLSPRSIEGSVLHDPEAARDHVSAMVKAGGIVTRHNEVIESPFHSICVHGDGRSAVRTARLVREALEDAGHQIAGLDKMHL